MAPNRGKFFGSFFQKRTTSLLLGFLTLTLLSLLIFAGTHLLPGDAGRAMLGPLADPRAVAALDHELGVDRGAAAGYAAWISGLPRGDFGLSYAYRAPIAPMLAAALARSLALAGLILALAFPAALLAGIAAARNQGGALDRVLTLGGLALTVVPEFVTAIVLMLVFGIWLRVLPIAALAPPGAGFASRLLHLLAPALPIVLALFGYLGRTVREACRRSLASDHIRTATLKGLPPHRILLRHVLPDVLPPVITVTAAQLGYVVGGLVVVETLFRYPGIGFLILSAARARDFPMLQAGVLAIGAIVIVANLVADALVAWLDPRST